MGRGQETIVQDGISSRGRGFLLPVVPVPVPVPVPVLTPLLPSVAYLNAVLVAAVVGSNESATAARLSVSGGLVCVR